MQSALERYEEVDYTFSGSREGKLLKARTLLHTWAAAGFWRFAVTHQPALACALLLGGTCWSCTLRCLRSVQRLSQDLAEAFEAGDAEQFTDAIAEFDSMTRLDAWKTTLLLRSKKRIGMHDEHNEPDLT